MNKGVALIILILVLPVSVTNTFGEQIYPIKECAHALEGRFAYGVYLNNQKVGWEVAESKIIEHGEGEVFVESLEMRTVLNYSGNIVISESKYKKVVYSLKDEGQIKNAESESKFFEENDLKTTTTYNTTRKNKQLFTVKKINKKKVLEKFIPTSEDTIAQECAFIEWINNPSRATGDTLNTFSFNQESDDSSDIDDEETTTYLGKKKIKWSGVLIDAVRVKYQTKNEDTEPGMEVTLLPNGALFSGNMGPIEYRLEEEAVAKNLEISALEKLNEVKVDFTFEDTEQLDSLTVKVSGIDGNLVPVSNRQAIELDNASGTFLVTLTRDRENEKPISMPATEKEKYTASTDSYQSDDTRIKNLAKEIVGAETNFIKATELLKSWVFDNLSPTWKKNESSAIRVLENMAGDCTEYTLLFVSLARSLGMPAREAFGLKYSVDPYPTFTQHAWAEVFDGEYWISVDPSWNQLIVDVGHIKLDDEITMEPLEKTLGLLTGNISISIVDSRALGGFDYMIGLDTIKVLTEQQKYVWLILFILIGLLYQQRTNRKHKKVESVSTANH